MTEPSASAEKRRVLIIDGDASFSRFLEEDFKTRGFIVETASTADKAATLVAASPPDLVVLDLYLSDGATLKLLRLWKTQAPTLVVILVSGNASLPIVVDALNEGARRFFTKPVGAQALLDELENRQSAQQPYLSPLLVANHQLGSGALKAEGVDRFFAISPGLLSVSGFDGYFKMLNPAWEKALGYSVDELCSKPHIELVHPDDRQKATDEALEIRGGQTVFRFKNRYRCKDGSYRWLSWIATPSPEHRLIYASARDVTNIVRMEQGLRDSNERLKKLVRSGEALLQESTVKNDSLVELGRTKDDVAAMIVHDLKNPLSVILANYDFVLEGFEGASDCLEALRDSQSAGQRMLRLLANLADVARLEGGTLEVRRSQTTLSQLVQPIVEQRRVLARARDIQIALLPSPEITVSVDAELVTRTVENIFDNALRHTPDGGSIEIELRDSGADVAIRIGNTGPAVPAGARDGIFGKYEQASPAVGRMNLGLGLYFCRLAIEAQGGKVWVEETERLPAVFAIQLPRPTASTPRTAPALVMEVDRRS
ncbi:MAG: multi-sensor hybrid histidine kinase [Myxococcales bacterium]|nr:multi-sensor hybrid histidine kinase [Myxococcales bacterium]